MKIFGIDPGSERTGYGCVESDGSRHRLMTCGAVISSPRTPLPERLLRIHMGLASLLRQCRPDCVAIETLFFATNVRSALKLGHARGVAMLAAVESGVPVVEYTPAEIKRAVVGYGRAEKRQVQQMVKLMLGLQALPSPHDAADALAVAICHLHSRTPPQLAISGLPAGGTVTRNWRNYRVSRSTEPGSAAKDGKSRSITGPGRRDQGPRTS